MGGGVGDAAKRAAAIAAAERRMQEVRWILFVSGGLDRRRSDPHWNAIQGLKRGTQATNANQGALSKELEKQKRGQGAEAALPERVVVCHTLHLMSDESDRVSQWD